MATTADQVVSKLQSTLEPLTVPEGGDDMPRTEGGVKRRVGFSGDVKEGYTPLAKTKKRTRKDPNKQIVEIWVRQVQEGSYEYLKEVLRDFGLQGKNLNRFFEQEGAFLLMCCLIYWNNPTSLKFVYDNVSTSIIKDVLSNNDYSLLDSYLIGETVADVSDSIDSNKIEARKLMLELLCKIDREGLQEFIESKYSLENYSERVRSDCLEAIRNSRHQSLRL